MYVATLTTGLYRYSLSYRKRIIILLLVIWQSLYYYSNICESKITITYSIQSFHQKQFRTLQLWTSNMPFSFKIFALKLKSFKSRLV